MKKYNMKRQKYTHEKKKRKITHRNVHCKGEKVLKFLSFSLQVFPLYRLGYEKLEPHPLCYF